jgi:4'-phosphopantetheinyl transferase
VSRPRSEWVHIWTASLQQDQRTTEQLTSFLSIDEKAKAASFRFNYLQVRYRVRRGILRRILASYTGIAPSELKLSCSATGKPSLMNAAELEFNTSDSEDLFACAVSEESQVEIDIERIRPIVELDSLAQTALTLTEFAWLMRQHPDDRLRSFFGVWTKKEAILKADGRGLSVDLRSFEINPDGPFPAALRLRNAAERSDLPYWISPFTPSSGYIGALAVRASPLEFTIREWKPR